MIFEHKKIVFLIIMTMSICIGAVQEKQRGNDSGKKRFISIMLNAVSEACEGKDNRVYVRNIAADINTEAIASFFACKTVSGHALLTNMLEHPFKHGQQSSAVVKRKEIIEALVKNPALKQQVDDLLRAAKNNEEQVIGLFSDIFIGTTCAEIKQIEIMRQQSPRLAVIGKFCTTNTLFRMIGSAIMYAGVGVYTAGLGFNAYSIYQLMKIGAAITPNLVSGGICGGAAALCSYSLYNDYCIAAEKRKKLHALNQLLAQAREVESLCAHYGFSPAYKVSDIQDQKGKEIIQQLDAARYKVEKSTFFMTSLVHSFLFKVYEHEKHLGNIFASIAEMDAYSAIATKIIESKNSDNKFCFADFLCNEKTSIRSNAFWNVLVSNPVVNNLQEEKNIILTGPNAGGKSTAIRALLQNIILAQSFGIAAAETFEFTPFDIIHSYLNVSDDLLQGLSLFASEVKRAKEILQTIENLEPNQKYFFALDELFTGTNNEEGQACASEFVRRLTHYTSIQFIYATHFDRLIALEEETGACVNYKVDMPTKGTDGKFLYPYTLSKGASLARVAFEIAQENNLFA